MEPEKDIGAVFAELTALLEDAAALAAEGQGTGVTPERVVVIAAELDRCLRACEALLAALAL